MKSLEFKRGHNKRYPKESKNLISFLTFICVLISWSFQAQVSSAVDTKEIKIGEQITYEIQVESNPEDLVLFPEGQSFKPLEMIESYEVDTLKKDAKFELIKKYGLTQFDSGSYTIPRQKILIGDKNFFTDSLKVLVNTIEVDSTKQGLYDIKPLIEVSKSSSDWWKTLLIILLIVAVLGALVYWFFFRKKALTEEEKIALLPPYDRAKLAIKKLEESPYLDNSEYKEYYSELTLAIRSYLDEKVYDHALESTTDELIARLKLLKEGNQIDFSDQTIKNLESILKRADLVKFAKSNPDKELAKLDRQTVDIEIDHVKEILPEPTEEEKLLDQKYQEELQRKRKQKKKMTIVAAVAGIVVIVFVAFGIKYGFAYVKDKLFQDHYLELLEDEWVESAYGVPPVYMETPKVLKRVEQDTDGSIATDITTFVYGSIDDAFSVSISTTVNQNPSQPNPMGQPGQTMQPNQQPQYPEIDVAAVAEKVMQSLEENGATNIVLKQDKYTTPNGAEGLKTYGTLDLSGDEVNYTLFLFVAENNRVLQQIFMTWPDDVYAEQISERMMNSLELKKTE